MTLQPPALQALPAALLLLAAAAHLLPEHVAAAWAQSRGAWEYVGRGFEGAALWALAAHTLRAAPLAVAVCAYGLWESLLQAGCRLLHPMTGPPSLAPGQGLCAAAGWPVGAWAPAMLAALAFALAWKTAKNNTTCKS